MMNQLPDEERMVIDLVKSIVRKEIAPRAAAIDELEEFPWDVVTRLATQGLFGIFIPAEYNGSPTSFRAFLLVVEELASACASTAVIYGTQANCVSPILGSGTEEIKQKYLPDLASGRKIGALAITEPEAGSDAGSIRTTAVRKGDRYILNGTKCFITSGNVAGTILTYARTGGPGPKGISAFVVENEFTGFSVGKVEKKLGIRGSTTAELIFKNCEVPLENRLGEEGEGFGIMVRGLTKSRLTVGAISVGIARGAFEAAVRYANERKQFGKRILEFQGMQFMFADMATKIEAARSLVYRGGALVDAEEREYAALASMAKLFASDIAVEVASMAVQAFGGYGFIRDYPVERSYRDAKITQIFEGTNQIQRMIIGRHFIE